MSTLTASPPAVAEATAADPRRWLALGIIAIAQLMIVVDASIVNIALPSAQRALHISNADRQWVITAYTLAFGGLLLLGGRVADYAGRKRIFVIGLLGFAAASALGGLAPNAALLFSARGLQGAFAALMAPAALSLITITFTEPRERAKAFGVYGAIAGGGLAIGLILGGVLTQYASWRWCLLVNIPISLGAAVAAVRVVRESRLSGRTRYDVPGALTSTLGLVALVYGVTKADTSGWSATVTLACLAAAAVLLIGFVAIEARSSQPLLPLRVMGERNRGGSFLTSLLLGSGLFGSFLFLTYYLQGSLHYSALKAGFAFLPFSGGIIVSAGLASAVIIRVRPRWVMGGGLVAAALGMLWFTQLGIHSAYLTHVFPAEVVMSMGMGFVFVPMSSMALTGVSEGDAGVASALINTTQQIGGSIGTALLNTIAATATAGFVRVHGAASLPVALVHGYAVAFAVAAALLGVALVSAVVLISGRGGELPAGLATGGALAAA